MTTSEVRPRGRTRAVLGAAAYCAGLAVVSAAGLGLLLVGRAATAARLSGRWQRLLGGAVTQPVRGLAVAGNALVGLLLGVLSLIPLGVGLLVVLRGVLYGLVDSGPYDHSWGGPTRGGAWLAHFLVGLPFAVAALAALYGIARLHRRWSAYLAGERGGAWTLPVVLALCAAGAALFVAWLHQI
jgi:hypothetical protein